MRKVFGYPKVPWKGGQLRIGRLMHQPQLDTDIPSAMVGGQLRIRRIIRQLQLDTKGNIWKHEPRAWKLKTTRIGDSKNYPQDIKISNTPTSMKPVCNAFGSVSSRKSLFHTSLRKFPFSWVLKAPTTVKAICLWQTKMNNRPSNHDSQDIAWLNSWCFH